MSSKTPGKPSLSPTEAERVLAALERLYKGRFEENKTALGKQLGISQPAVTQLMAGVNKPSLDTARAVARLEGLPVSSYLDGMAVDEPTNDQFPSRAHAARAARNLLMPDWAIEKMLAEDPPQGVASDPGPMFWFRRIEMLVAAPPHPAPPAEPVAGRTRRVGPRQKRPVTGARRS